MHREIRTSEAVATEQSNIVIAARLSHCSSHNDSVSMFTEHPAFRLMTQRHTSLKD